MLEFGFYNMDCMEGMKEFPDKYFELAIVDPPYGIGDWTENNNRKKIKGLSELWREQFAELDIIA